MQNRGRPALVLSKACQHSIGGASAVNGVDAASAILSRREDPVENFELDLSVLSMGGRSIESNLADVPCFIEQPFQERDFVKPFVSEFGMKAKRRTDVALSLRESRRFWPGSGCCRHRQNVDASFLAIRRHLLWIIEEIEMAVEVYQTANPSEER